MLARLMELLGRQEEETAATDEERLRTATCVLLLEVAGADDEFSPEECDRIIRVLCGRFALSQDEAEELVRAAGERRAKSFDLWKFTNQINELCSTDEKTQIIEEIWRVIYADGTLDAHEDYIAHKLARLLNLTHPQLIAAKLKALEEARG